MAACGDRLEEVPTSWGDPLNYCEVDHVEYVAEELLVRIMVVGILQDSTDSEVRFVSSSGEWVARGRVLELTTDSHGEDDCQESTLAFDSPVEFLHAASDVVFTYASGYSGASLLELLPLPMARNRTRSSNGVVGSSQTQLGAAGYLAYHSPQTLGAPNLEGYEVLDRLKREDGFKKSRPSQRDDYCCSRTSDARAWASCAAIDTGHDRVAVALQKRLQALRALRGPWCRGDAAGLARALDSSRDDALAYGALRRLQEHTKPISPHELPHMIRLAQQVAQSDCEEHAVSAMRFGLAVMEVSWPAVAQSLRNVATPHHTRAACEDVIARLTSLYGVVKNMSKSVRIARTNGPLIPACRKLRVALEDSLETHTKMRT